MNLSLVKVRVCGYMPASNGSKGAASLSRIAKTSCSGPVLLQLGMFSIPGVLEQGGHCQLNILLCKGNSQIEF